MIRFDNHIHSYHSPDSRMELETAARQAVEQSFRGICFSDHYDFDAPEGIALFTFDVEKQQEEIETVQKKFPEIVLLRGAEIGIQPVSMGSVKNFMRDHVFDTVFASMHFVRGTDPYHGSYYNGYDYKKAYSIYLEDILYCIEGFADYDILGHFDYVARYAPYREHIISLKDFGEILDPILRMLAENGKTFEINTKTYQSFPYGTPQLDLQILRRFRELGGDAVSLGSDAHGPERIGDRFGYYSEVLKQCGYRYGVFYRNRKPEYFKIDM